MSREPDSAGICADPPSPAGDQARRDLARHVGHEVVCLDYAGGRNVAIECQECAEVLWDSERAVTEISADLVPIEVWVCMFEHRYGIDVWAWGSEEIAYHGLARVCREFWDEAREVEDSFSSPEEGEPLPPTPPEEDRSAVELYFGVMNDADRPESYLIAAHELITGDGGDEDERR
jgi:hypothetical protein